MIQGVRGWREIGEIRAESRWSTVRKRGHLGPQDNLILMPYARIPQCQTPITLAPDIPHSEPQTLSVCLPKTPPLWTHKAHHPEPPRACLPPILSGVVFNEVYAASKFALEGFFESLAVQLLQFNIL